MKLTHRIQQLEESATLAVSSKAAAMCAALGMTSQVNMEPDIPFTPAALVSCGVATGWGSAVNRAQVRPGDTVSCVYLQTAFTVPETWHGRVFMAPGALLVMVTCSDSPAFKVTDALSAFTCL